MLRQRTFAVAFPMIVVAVVGAERLASWLLGMFPANANLWMAAIELRAAIRPLSNFLAGMTGGNIFLQAIGLVLMAVCAWALFGTRKWQSTAIAVNHFSLIALLTIFYVNGAPSVAGLATVNWETASTFPSLTFHMDLIQLMIAAIGIAACAFTHFCFLSDASRRERAIARAMGNLIHDPADRPHR